MIECGFLAAGENMYQKENYSLEIVSCLSDFKGKALKKYKLEGIETIGAWGNEPFEIRFKNNTYAKVQVKISLDGTDILTGEQATSEPTSQMWVVNGGSTLTLKAWPESNNGGAQFVFTSADKSVAVHTHGDLSHRGIIAAAVFTEGHVEPIRLTKSTEHYHIHHYPKYDWWSYPTWIGGGGTFGSSSITNASYNASDTKSANFYSSTTTDTLCSNVSDDVVPAAQELQSLASVGAGSYTEQKITYTTGLIKPLLSETVRVKYVWWDDLVAALRTNAVAKPHPSGFPGDKPMLKLGNTPRVNTVESNQRLQEQLNFARF